MENKFKVGDRVRVKKSADTRHFDDAESYISKKGEIRDNSCAPYVKFKDGQTWSYSEDDLRLCKPKRHRFDLDRALKGDEVINRENEPIDFSNYYFDSQDNTFCLAGTHWYKITGKSMSEKRDYNLFMRYPATESKPVTDLPKFAAELMTQAVPNPVCDGIDRLKSELEGKPEKDYNKLESQFMHLLDCYTVNMKKQHGFSEKDVEDIKHSWKLCAGLPV